MKDDNKTKKQLIHELTELRSQKAALEKSEIAEKYKSLVENIRDVIYELDSQGVVLYISPAIRDMLGYDSVEIVGKSFIDLAHKDDQSSLAEWFSELRKGTEFPSEYRISNKSGELRWARTKTRPIMEDGLFKGAHGILIDVTAQKRVEVALRESETKYRLIAENTADLISILDMNLRFTYVSPATMRLRGFTVEEAMEQTLEQVLTPESMRLGLTVFEEEMQLESSGTADPDRMRILELEEYKKDGSIIWVEVSFSILRDKDRKPVEILMVSRDITERKRAEEALRERDVQFMKLSSWVPGMIYQFTKRTDGTYCVPFTTEAIKDIFGCSPQDVREDFSPIARIILPEDSDKVLSSIEYSATHLTIWTCEYRVQIPGQPIRWILGKSTPEKLADGSVTWYGFNTDITERKQVEHALRENEERFRKIFEDAHLVGMVITAPSFAFEKANPAFCRMMGYSEEELRSMTFADITHPDHLKQDMENVKKVGRGEIPFYQTEKRYINKSGKMLWGNLIVSSIRDEHGALQYYLSMVIDITEQKKAMELFLEAHNKYQDLTESISDVFFAMDKKLIYTHWNKASEKLTGVSAEKALGKSLLEIFPDNEARKQAQDVYLLTIESKKPQHLTINYPGDELIVHEISSYPTIEGVSVFVKDVTDRKKTEKQLQDTLESLRKAVGTTIQVISSTVEARDPYTSGHQIRSADLARAIAMEMGLPQDKIDGIRMAGSIHDIGKISIPAEILSKPTKLSEIEFSLIKEHARKGYEMLKDVESPWPLAEIVHQHHERMDGSGYPRNLKGEEICIEARILSVADVVEAMASHRPYRPGLGIDTALNEIEKNKGLFYDEAVADACLRLFREKGFKLEGIAYNQ